MAARCGRFGELMCVCVCVCVMVCVCVSDGQTLGPEHVLIDMPGLHRRQFCE